MRISIIFIVLFLNVSLVLSNSIDQLEESTRFNFKWNYSLDSSLANFIVEKVESARANESATKFKKTPYVTRKGTFGEFPCIALYSLTDEWEEINPKGDPFENILFNQCDSSMYYFGGNWSLFSKLFQNNLPDIINSKQFFDLIFLYLNTIAEKDAYYLLISKNDYEAIWEEQKKIYNSDTSFFNQMYKPEFINDDTRKVKDLISHFSILENGDYYEIKVYSWHRFGGEIERWVFRISNSNFEVVDRKTILLNMGPYVK